MPLKWYQDMESQLVAMKDQWVNVQVMLSLFSFECANNLDCVHMINTTEGQMAYIENGLKPMLKYIKDKNLTDRIFAIELFNEPEWMIDRTGYTNYSVDLGSIQNFTKACN